MAETVAVRKVVRLEGVRPQYPPIIPTLFPEVEGKKMLCSASTPSDWFESVVVHPDSLKMDPPEMDSKL